MLMTSMLQDVRYAVRILIAAPGFTLAALLTLALGIGANIAMFSVVYGVLLRPLPYREADRLVLVRADVDYVGAVRPSPISVPATELPAWQQPLDAITTVAGYAPNVEALVGENGAEVLDSAIVSSTFFTTVAGPLTVGRALGAEDDGVPSAVISTRLARRLVPDPAQALGRTLTLSTRAYTIVGVADPAFQIPSARVDVWLPAGFVRSVNPRCCSFSLVARLDADGTIDRATAAARAVFEASPSAQRQGTTAMRTRVVRLRDDLVAGVRPALLVLFGSVLLVLAIACSNLINLLLARNASRQREFAIRRALGAPAGRLLRQLLVESGLLVAAGTAGGVILASYALAALSAVAADGLPRADAIHLDHAALLFAAVLATLATLVTASLPALRATRTAAIPNQNAGHTATSAATRRLQRTLCAVQVALAVVLLAGATLMGRSLVQLLHVDLGVSTDHVLTASLNLAFGQRPPDALTLARVGRVIEQVGALPGVSAVGAGTGVPPNLSRMRVTLRRSGDTVDYQASAVPATPGYFSALQMRLVKGRFFSDADDDRHPQAMIMTEETAARFFGERDPIGRTMSLPVLREGKNTSVEMTLVGVVANVKYAGLAAPSEDVVYRPFAQQPWVAPFLVVRTEGDPAALAVTLRRAIAAADPGVVTGTVTSLDRLVRDAAAQPQFRTVLLSALATLALGIAAIGLYGVVAYAVAQRAREIGIRIALGATPRAVLAMVVKDGVFIAVTGIVTGTACALALARVLSGMLYGIAATDPLSFIAAASGLLTLTLLASYLPARRAARIDPIRTLRGE